MAICFDCNIYINEPTFTDLFLIECMKYLRDNLFFHKPTQREEANTGTDIELLVTDNNYFYGIVLYIQAKRLDQEKDESGIIKGNIKRRIKCKPDKYRGVGRKIGSTDNYQIDELLCSTGKGAIPLYFFYNYWCPNNLSELNYDSAFDFGISFSSAEKVKEKIYFNSNIPDRNLKFIDVNYTLSTSSISSKVNSFPLHLMFDIPNFSIKKLAENFERLLEIEVHKVTLNNEIVRQFNIEILNFLKDRPLKQFLYTDKNINYGRLLTLIKCILINKKNQRDIEPVLLRNITLYLQDKSNRDEQANAYLFSFLKKERLLLKISEEIEKIYENKLDYGLNDNFDFVDYLESKIKSQYKFKQTIEFNSEVPNKNYLLFSLN